MILEQIIRRVIHQFLDEKERFNSTKKIKKSKLIKKTSSKTRKPKK